MEYTPTAIFTTLKRKKNQNHISTMIVAQSCNVLICLFVRVVVNESDRVNFIKARNHTNHVIEQARRGYYFNLINENDCYQRKTASALLGGSSQEQYPKHFGPNLLANDFGRFFIQKIDVIRSKLDRIHSSLNHPHHSIGSSIQEYSFAGTPFNNFQPISSEGIKKLQLVMNAPNKTCDNDPIPTKIVKDCINELLLTISNMVNLSFSSGHFPDIWKEGLAQTKVKERQHGSDKEKLPQSCFPFKNH